MTNTKTRRALFLSAAAGLCVATTTSTTLAQSVLNDRGSRSASARASSTTQTARVAQAPNRSTKSNTVRSRITAESIRMSRAIHDMRYDIAGDRLNELLLDRQRPLAERARERFEQTLQHHGLVQWDIPEAPMVGRATGRPTRGVASNGTVSPRESTMSGGVYVPRSWGITDTPFGPEIHIPYTFDPFLIQAAFGSTFDDLAGDAELFNASFAIANILAVHLILETDLIELEVDLNGDGVITVDPANPGFDELIPLKFVGYNQVIHDRALIYTSEFIDPILVLDWFGLDPDGNTMLPDGACINTIDGFGAPSLQDPEFDFAQLGTPTDDDSFDLNLLDGGGGEIIVTAARIIDHCNWTNVGDLTRQIGFTLGLTWHQNRDDRDTYVELFPERVVPVDRPSDDIIPALLNFLPANLTTIFVQWVDVTTSKPTHFADVPMSEYDPFSLMHGDAFTLSSAGLPVFEPLEPMLGTAAVARENFRRENDLDPLTVPIPGSPASSDPDVQAGLDELVTLIGFVPEFSVGDINTIEHVFSEDRWFPGREPRCPADVNGDGVQDFADLEAFAQFVAIDNPNAAGDINLNGFVDPGDFTSFLTLYTSGQCEVDFDPDGEINNGFVTPDGCDFDVNDDFRIDFLDRIAFADDFSTNNPVADLNGDLLWDQQDLSIFDDGFEEGDCQTGITPPRPDGCPLDVDGNGVQNFADRTAFNQFIVDANNLALLAQTRTRALAIADRNFDGLANEADYAIFDAEFNEGTCDPGSATPIPSGCEFDLSGPAGVPDGRQDFYDRIAFAAFITAGNRIADLNFDGIVNGLDYGAFDAVFNEGDCATGFAAPIPDGCDLNLPDENGNVDSTQDWNDRVRYIALLNANNQAANLNFDTLFNAADYAVFDTRFNEGVCNPGSATPISTGCLFDIDGDTDQDWADRELFAAQLDADFLNKQTVPLSDGITDLTFDDIIDSADYAQFVNNRFQVGTCQLGIANPITFGCPLDISDDRADPTNPGSPANDLRTQDWRDIIAFTNRLQTNLANGIFETVLDLNFDDRTDFNDVNTLRAQFNFGNCLAGSATPQFTGCAADIDADGDQDWDDRRAYAALLVAGNLATDISGQGSAVGNGVIDATDFTAFDVDTGLFAQLGECPASGANDPVPNGCQFDVNVDGEQTFADREAFGMLVAAGNPAADINGDSFVDEFDIQQFNNAFTTGNCVDGTPQDAGPNSDGCPFDLDNNNKQDFNDLLAFVALWNSGNPAADFNGDGFLDVSDLQQFLQAFTPGFCSPNTPDGPDPDNRPDNLQPIGPA